MSLITPIFTGHYSANVDAKNRVSVPADFRRVIKANSWDHFGFVTAPSALGVKLMSLSGLFECESALRHLQLKILCHTLRQPN